MICCASREETNAEVIVPFDDNSGEEDVAKITQVASIEASVALGRYTVVFDNLPVNLTADRSSQEITRLSAGTVVNVLQVERSREAATSIAEIHRRIRGRIEFPPGWITMQSADSRCLFVVPSPFEEVAAEQQDEPCPRCGAMVVKNAKFCSNCGARVQGNGDVGQWKNGTNTKFLDESQPPPAPEDEQKANGEDPEKAREESGHEIERYDSFIPDKKDGDEFELKILFWHKGEETWTSFRRKPLGMRWRMKPPIKIDEVLTGSHAWEQGVEKGWQIKMIDDQDMSGMTYRTIAKALQAGLDRLPWEKGADGDDRN